jgi:uncharacterized membrane protein YsdA (DUF1294 family)
MHAARQPWSWLIFDVRQMSTQRSQKLIRPKSGRSRATTIVTLCFLLALPAYALSRITHSFNWKILVGAPLAMSAFAFFAYRSDKRSAEAGEWRIPEATLHLISLIGGWPGAFLAQRALRHKTSKTSFQFVFWSVVLLHQFVALDSLLMWRFTKDAIRAIKSHTA